MVNLIVGLKKIFDLSEDLPSAMMFNGLMDFENLSMETLIGQFKKITDFKELNSIEEIKDMFVNFLSKTTECTNLEDYLNFILKSFKDDFLFRISSNGFDRVIKYEKRDQIPNFLKKLKSFENEFFDIIPNEKNKSYYNQVIWEIFSHELHFEGTTIVFVGFDKENYYPSFFEINIYCNNNGKIVYEEIDSIVNCQKPLIKIFAMNEEAYTFITGVNSQFEKHIIEYVDDSNRNILRGINSLLIKEEISDRNLILDICETAILDEYGDFEQYIKKYRVDSIEDTSFDIEYLPRSVTCELAEFLIKLTSLKQKISSDIESVNMKSDIALMTMVDGFKWIKFDEERV